MICSTLNKHDDVTSGQLFAAVINNGDIQCSCYINPKDRGAGVQYKCIIA